MRVLAILAGAASLASATDYFSGQRELSFFAGSSGADEPSLDAQRTVCKPVRPPLTCEKSCGAGQITCVQLPSCYNPGAGESCCRDGSEFL